MSTIRKTLKDKDGNYICPAIPSRSIEGGDIKLNTIKAENIDFTTFNKTLVINNYITSLQSTNNYTTGVNINTLNNGTNMGDIELNLTNQTDIIVAATFPLSTSGTNGNVDLYMDDTLIGQICTTQEQTSHHVTGFMKIGNVSSGTHHFGFKLRANINQTAYIGAWRTISVAILPV